MRVGFKLDKGVELPQYVKEGDSGFDIRAVKIKAIYKNTESLEEKDPERFQKAVQNFQDREYILVRSGERILFGSGIYPELPEGIELQDRPKSGQALKKGLIIVNTPGTIDNNYKGEIGTILMNPNEKLVKIEKGERIAQLVPANILKVEICEIKELSQSERGEKGFGSSGIK